MNTERKKENDTVESLSDKATEKRLEQLEQDKERFLEGV